MAASAKFEATGKCNIFSVAIYGRTVSCHEQISPGAPNEGLFVFIRGRFMTGKCFICLKTLYSKNVNQINEGNLVSQYSRDQRIVYML